MRAWGFRLASRLLLFACAVIVPAAAVACGKTRNESPPSQAACDRILAGAEDPVVATYKVADKACVKDGDCEAVSASPCFSDCNSRASTKTFLADAERS